MVLVRKKNKSSESTEGAKEAAPVGSTAKASKKTASSDPADWIPGSDANVEDIDVGPFITERMTKYGMYVLEDRATPRVEDGLRPVQRRLLWTAHNLNAKTWKKCASITGRVIGDYHPHGDMAAYGALVSMHFGRLQLIEGHGNFGDPDTGDGPAANRYTEARIGSAASRLALDTPDLELAPMVPSYNAQNEEPVFLPMRLPVLLLQGCEAIGVGQGTNIPPFNLGEVIEACEIGFSTGRWNAAADKIKAPDYGRGRCVSSPAAIAEVIRTGTGSLEYDCQYQFELVESGKKRKKQAVKQLLISSLAPDISLPRLLERFALLRNEGVLDSVTEISDKVSDHIQLVVHFSNEKLIQQKVLPLLRTKIHYAFNVLTPAVKTADAEQHYAASLGRVIDVTDEGEDVRTVRPRLLNVAKILRYWSHSRVALVKATLNKRKLKLATEIEKQQGKLLARQQIDKLLDIVRGGEDLVPALQAKLKLTLLQAETVAAMRVDTLQKSSQQKIESDLQQLQVEHEACCRQLDDIPGTIVAQLQELRQWFEKTKPRLLERMTAIGEQQISIKELRSDVKYVLWCNDKVETRLSAGRAAYGCVAFRDQLVLVFGDGSCVTADANSLARVAARTVNKSKDRPLVGVVGDIGQRMVVVNDRGMLSSYNLPLHGRSSVASAGVRAAVNAKTSDTVLVLHKTTAALAKVSAIPVGVGSRMSKSWAPDGVSSKDDFKSISLLSKDDKTTSFGGKAHKLPKLGADDQAARVE